MTSPDLLRVLAETSLASSAAIVLVLLVRRPLRRWFGASAAHAAWATVPAAVVAVMLPAMPVAVLPRVALEGFAMVGTVPASDPHAGTIPAAWIVVAWLCGTVAMAVRLGLQQRAFVRSLGTLRMRSDGLHEASAVAGLPAVIGLVRPRTVVPADFDSRYSREQQALLRAHEQAHVTHGDLWANALVALLRCASWFNPLMHLAARCFRHDQELACDQRVLAARPGSRRSYGEAMFTTQLAAQPLPLGCHWGFGHPLKERITMLKQPLPTPRRLIAGTSLATLLTLSVGVGAWAAQPPAPVDATDRAAGGASQDTRLLSPPKYPAEALANDVSGKVVLLVDIDAHGNPTAIAVKSAEPAGVFEKDAVAAAWNWKFNPAIENGKPVASQVLVPVQFEADGDPPEDGRKASGAMGWSSTAGDGRVAEMTCDEVRVKARSTPECGNRLAVGR